MTVAYSYSETALATGLYLTDAHYVSCGSVYNSLPFFQKLRTASDLIIIVIIIITSDAAQYPLTSDACFTIFCQLLRSSAKWLISCRFSPHHSTISSVHSLCGRPLLFLPSIFPKSSIFSFLSSDIRRVCPKSCSFLSITVCSRLCS